MRKESRSIAQIKNIETQGDNQCICSFSVFEMKVDDINIIRDGDGDGDVGGDGDGDGGVIVVVVFVLVQVLRSVSLIMDDCGHQGLSHTN